MAEPYDYKATELSPAENCQRMRRWLRGWSWIIGAIVVLLACMAFITAPIELPPDDNAGSVSITSTSP